ncbi:hypothetical protein MARINON1_50792 [Marinobacter salarius]|nr:hypothetical protein MBHK15_130820 [Marinobacter salarius]VXB58243.1 hypothetical protein MARINON1_50792 [Marinobacter salarius]
MINAQDELDVNPNGDAIRQYVT